MYVVQLTIEGEAQEPNLFTRKKDADKCFDAIVKDDGMFERPPFDNDAAIRVASDTEYDVENVVLNLWKVKAK